jgi:hypothetical protein
MNLKTCGVALALALLPMTALAQSATPDPAKEVWRAKFRAACGADVQKFCANIEHAKGATRTCLTTHENELSDSCKAARAERAAARAKEKS